MEHTNDNQFVKDVAKRLMQHEGLNPDDYHLIPMHATYHIPEFYFLAEHKLTGEEYRVKLNCVEVQKLNQE